MPPQLPGCSSPTASGHNHGGTLVALEHGLLFLLQSLYPSYPDEKIVIMQFLISRQMAHVHSRHLTIEVLMEQSLDLSQVLHSMPGIKRANAVGGIAAFQKTLELVAARWSRLGNYSADACGYLVCGDLEVSVRTILKTIFNSTILANNLDLKEYISQADSIDALDGIISSYSERDEMVPYGPYRIKELIRYASSRRGKEALRLTKSAHSTTNDGEFFL